MSDPTPESRVAGPLRSLEVGSLDDQIRRAETAVVRRDQRLKRQFSEASLRGRDAVHGGGMWVLAGLGAVVAGWLAYRATPGARRARRREEEAHRRTAARRGPRGDRSAAREHAETAKSASKLGMLGAAVTLISTVAQAFGSGPKVSSPWVWLGRTAWGGMQRFRTSSSGTTAAAPRARRPVREPASASRYGTASSTTVAGSPAAASTTVVRSPAAVDVSRRRSPS